MQITLADIGIPVPANGRQTQPFPPVPPPKPGSTESLVAAKLTLEQLGMMNIAELLPQNAGSGKAPDISLDQLLG